MELLLDKIAISEGERTMPTADELDKIGFAPLIAEKLIRLL